MVRWVYFDASALIKRYSAEVGTPIVNAIFERAYPTQVTCATLGVLEVVASLVRKHNDGRLSRSAYEQALIEVRAEIMDRAEVRLAALSDELFFRALDLITRHNLNATDAVILRSVLDVQAAVRATGDEVMVCCADKRLLRAAQSEGLLALDPEVETVAEVERMLNVGR